jgi:arabinofuranosyltransferase
MPPNRGPDPAPGALPASRGSAWPRALLLVVLFAGAVAGARALEFLCDDAFLAFRCVANARAGHGLVFNTPPFLPVEGYTDFLWLVVLRGIWAATGVEPPQAANAVSLLCTLGMLAIAAAAALRWLPRDPRGAAGWTVWLALAAIAGNRTFLTWASSGLGAAWFAFWFVAWTVFGFARAGGARWWTAWSLLAAVCALSRPDGVLCVAGTVAAAGVAVARGDLRLRSALAALAPVLLMALHLLWRRATYGEWVPNTYFAKVTSAWPDAGWRYAACFALESGTWLWLLLAAAWLCLRARAGARPTCGPRAVAVAVVAAHAAYLTLIVGGDHFEYRIYVHLVPLTLLSGVRFAADLGGPAIRAAAVAALAVASGAGWVQHALTRDGAAAGYVAIADRLPAAVRPLARAYDRWQAWLAARLIGVRPERHAEFVAAQHALYPARAALPHVQGDVPVHAVGAVGVAGWLLPNVAIVDLFGLCDAVVARTPPAPRAAMPAAAASDVFDAADVDRDGRLSFREVGDAAARYAPHTLFDSPRRFAPILWALAGGEAAGLDRAGFVAAVAQLGDGRCMAHERRPPPGYVAAFRPNVRVANGRAVAAPREQPLGEAEIRAVEAAWRARAAVAPR